MSGFGFKDSGFGSSFSCFVLRFLSGVGNKPANADAHRFAKPDFLSSLLGFRGAGFDFRVSDFGIRLRTGQGGNFISHKVSIR